MRTLILLRHGQSTWNEANLFTGWTDVGLTAKGAEEARKAGRLIKDAGYPIDMAFTSVLRRAIKTLWLALEEMDRMWIPVERSWRLNERHYGKLQGANKMETVKKHGSEQVQIWRRSYDVPPPALEPDDERNPGRDPRYQNLEPGEIPLTESLKLTVDRVLPYWHKRVVPELESGKQILIASHGNSLRALVKYLDDVPEKEIVGLNIPTGIPLVYELEDNLKPLRSFYIGDPDAVEKATQTVADQTATDHGD